MLGKNIQYSADKLNSPFDEIGFFFRTDETTDAGDAAGPWWQEHVLWQQLEDGEERLRPFVCVVSLLADARKRLAGGAHVEELDVQPVKLGSGQRLKHVDHIT